MKKNRLYIFTVLACACTVFFAACNGSAKTDNVFTVSGKVIFPDALPSQLAAAINANSNSRSATSSFSSIPAGYEFKTKADLMVEDPEDPDQGAIVAETVNVNLNTEDWTWSATFSQAGYWVIEVSLVSTEEPDSILLAGNATINCNSYNTYEKISIQLFPCYFTDVTSSISLDLYDSTKKQENALSSVYCSWNSAVTGVDLPSVLENKSFSFTDKRATISYEEVPTGYYELLLSFRDSNDKELYFCRQIVTIFAGFTTDTWMNDLQLISDVVIDEENNITEKRFILTDELLKTYQPAVSIDYPIVLYDLDMNSNQIEFSEPHAGFYVYPDLKSMNVTSPDDAYLQSLYMPSDKAAIDPITQTIYTANGWNPMGIWKYTKNYTGQYTSEKIYEFSSGFSIQSMCAYDGYVYILQNNDSSNAIIQIADKANVSEENKVVYLAEGTTIAGQSVHYRYTHMDVCDNNIYLTSMADLNLSGVSAKFYVTKVPIVQNDSGANELGTPVSIYRESFESESSSSIEVNDMFTITDIQAVKQADSSVNLYILCNTRNISSYSARASHLRGGIITVKDNGTDLSFIKFDGTAFASGEVPTIFGWSTCYLQDAITDSNYEKLYFYGPTKFVARKPDELVIVDEGNYFVNADGDVTSSYKGWDNNNGIETINKNRVVCVSLKDFAITDSTDVEFGFEVFLQNVPSTYANAYIVSSYRGSSYAF